MIKLLQELILNAQELLFFTGILRHADIQPVDRKATVIMGVRRCGKTTFLNQIIMRLYSEGVNRENMLYLNFFDDRLANLKNSGPDPVLEAYFSLFPRKKNAEKIYCFFDEIQVIPHWEQFVDRMMRTENCEVYLSGSSANMLSKEIATQMRGRAISWELFPFSFSEFLDFKQLKRELPLSTRDRLGVQHAFENYWQTGGFPEVFHTDKNIRVKIHQEYFNTVLYHDLIERYDIPHPRAVIDLARKLGENIASLYTINSLTGYLKSLGHNVPKSAVADYLTWFEDAYFFFTLRIFDSSWSRSNVNPKKIYCVDHSLVNSVTSGIMVNSGHLLENLAFIGLRRVFNEIYYYKTKKNREVDFLVITPGRDKLLFQVTESLMNQDTRSRETEALIQAMKELSLQKAVIISRNEEEEISHPEGTIEVIPVWKFLLQMEEKALTN